MDHAIGRAALALGLLAGSITAPALAQAAPTADAPLQTNAPMTPEEQFAALQRQIAAQQAQITALQDQLRDVTAILANRVDRVEAQTENGRVIMANPSPRLEGASGRHSLAFVGGVQATVGTVDEDNAGSSAPVLHGGTEIKRARIGLQGTAFSDLAYAVEFELAQLPGATPSVAAAARDLWVQYNGLRPLSLTLGNMKPQVGLEASFSDRSNAHTFLETSMATSLITTLSTRALGLRATTGGAHWSSALGVYGDDVNNNGVAAPNEEGFGVHGRLTWAPIVSPGSLLHVGVSGYARDVGTAIATATATTPLNPAQLRPRAQPESSIDAARLIDAGNLSFADTVSLIALEAAALRGPVGFQAEYARMQVRQFANRPDLIFAGGYVALNWFMTGESRSYDPSSGVFTRLQPRANLDPAVGNWGAWEIAARWSTLDLNSEDTAFAGPIFVGARGGEETNYTLGLNWYWNAYFRMMLNYVHADADKRGLPGNSTNLLLGANQSATADLVALRVMQEW